jgi:hypothetical protein
MKIRRFVIYSLPRPFYLVAVDLDTMVGFGERQCSAEYCEVVGIGKELTRKYVLVHSRNCLNGVPRLRSSVARVRKMVSRDPSAPALAPEPPSSTLHTFTIGKTRRALVYHPIHPPG